MYSDVVKIVPPTGVQNFHKVTLPDYTKYEQSKYNKYLPALVVEMAAEEVVLVATS